MDRMAIHEMHALMKYRHHRHRESWEQTRFLGYIVAQANSTKKLSPQDLVKFPWEKAEEEPQRQTTSEDLERLKAKARRMIENNMI